MPKAPSPERSKAFELWKAAGGDIEINEIARQLGIDNPATVRGWKARDNWEGKLKGNELKKNTTRVDKNKTRVDSFNWVDLETEYVTDISREPVTLEDVSRKYGIPYKTVADYSTTNKWKDKRKEYRDRVKEKAIEKAANDVSTEIAEINKKNLNIAALLAATVEKALTDPAELFKHVDKCKTAIAGEMDEKVKEFQLTAINDKKISNLAAALEKVMKVQRAILGVMDEKDIKKLELEVEKLKLAQEKAGQGEEPEIEDDGFMAALNDQAGEVWEGLEDENDV